MKDWQPLQNLIHISEKMKSQKLNIIPTQREQEYKTQPHISLKVQRTKITASIFDCSFNKSIDIVKLESTSISTGVASAQITALIVAIIVIFGIATLLPFVIPFATMKS